MTMRVVARSHQARSNTSRRYSSQRRDSPVCNAEPPIMLAQKGFSTSRSRILGTTTHRGQSHVYRPVSGRLRQNVVGEVQVLDQA